MFDIHLFDIHLFDIHDSSAMIQNYLTIAFRTLWKNRSFSLLNTLGLGLSIGCSILIFLMVRHHLTFDRFHKNADRMAMIVTESTEGSGDHSNVTPYPMAGALRQEYSFLEKTAMVSSRDVSLITLEKPGQAPVKFNEADQRAFAEPELFEMFDFPLIAGDLKRFSEPKTALISEKTARKFYGTVDAVGQIFKVNNGWEYQVVGVLKDAPANTELQYQIYCSWATLQADSSRRGMLQNWGGISGGTQCFVMYREGHGADELETAFLAFRDKYYHPEVRDWYYHPVALKSVHLDPLYGSGIGTRYLWALGLIGFFLLLTACVNFVNMATAQALNRAREVGVRKTMGSSRMQIFWQFLLETGLIACFSMLMGITLAWIGQPYLNRLTGSNLVFNLASDPALGAYLAVLTLFVTFAAGAYPGLVLSGFRPAESLKGGSDMRKMGGFSLRRMLVASQFAISQMLIIGAVVVTAQMEYARNADMGFRKDGIVTVPIPEADKARLSTLRQELSAQAGVQNVSFCMQPPASEANWNTNLRFEGRTENETWVNNLKFVDDQYAGTFDLQFLVGRNIEASDTMRECVVNEVVVKKLGLASPADILNKKISIAGHTIPVVGVVKNFHTRSFREAIDGIVLCSKINQYDVCAMRIQMGNSKATLAAIEKVWTGVFPEYFYESEFMDERLESFYTQESMILQLIRLFAGIAIFVGCLGLYGLSAYMVARKSKEIGIRKTLGASLGGILWLFGREYTRLILAAFVVAAPAAWWVMHNWLQDYTFRISIGAGIFALALGATFLIAVLTVGLQSARAALANPVRALRSE
jgi:putative ABC transport system permease protein